VDRHPVPQAVFDDDTGRWISDAQIAETGYTAFAGTRHAVTARLIVRRIRRDDPARIPGQEETGLGASSGDD
jgi:hypothetical protein